MRSRILLSLVLTLIPTSAFAQFTFHDGAPTQGRLAFTYIKDKQSDIYVIDFAQRSAKPLVASPKDDEYPVWSPDGKQLAFYSDMSGDREIYVINPDGTGQKQLTTSPGVDEDPYWSPDGTQIIFRSERSGKGSQLYVMKADGSDQKPVTTGKRVHSVPRWSPTSQQVLFSSNEDRPGWDIMLLDLASGNRRQLTNGFRTFCHASWDPSGASYVYSSGYGNNIDLWVSPVNSEGEPQQITTRPGRDYDAVWKDGNTLFFVGELNPGKEDYQLFTISLPTKQVTQLVESPGAMRDPAWMQ